MQGISRLTIIVNDQTFNHSVLQNDVTHHRHVVTSQLRNSFSEGRISQKSEKRRKQFIIRKFFGNHQVVALLKQWHEIQIQRLRRSGNAKMSILFLKIPSNGL